MEKSEKNEEIREEERKKMLSLNKGQEVKVYIVERREY